MSAVPSILIKVDQGVFCHFCGLIVVPEGYWVQFSIREGLDGDDLSILQQEILDTDHEIDLSLVVEMARKELVRNLATISDDILELDSARSSSD